MSEEQKVEEKEPEQMKRYVKIPGRYPTHCAECKSPIKVGDPLVWDTAAKKSYCADCGGDLLEGQRDANGTGA